MRDGQGAQLQVGNGGEPGVVKAIRQLARHAQVLQGAVGVAQGGLKGAGGECGDGSPEGLVLVAELLQGGRHLLQGALEVAGDRRSRAHDQLAYCMQEGVLDLLQQRFQASAGGQRRLVVAYLAGDYRRRPLQFGLGLAVEGGGGG